MNKYLLKMALELSYDYNTEEKDIINSREILDHEHEKIDQFKVKLRIAHDAKLYKAPKNEKLAFSFKKKNLILI